MSGYRYDSMIDVDTKKTWRLIDVLKEATAYLNTKGIENPRLNAERLMSHLLQIERIDLYLRFEQLMNQKERDAYKTILFRRAKHEPLQYVLGETEFMSLHFKLTPAVLIPRPETELLVEQIVACIGDQKGSRVLDIGAGSGNIGVSLAKYLPEVSITAVDTSDEVLTLAEENAEKNGVGDQIQFILANVKQENFVQVVKGPFDIVVSNPPYVSSDDFAQLPGEIREYEPREALCDDRDGLSFYPIIAQKSVALFQSGGRLFFEIGDGQSQPVQSILKEAGYGGIQVFSDLNGIERVVCGHLVQKNHVKR
ncbi:peptide chain release factor N(5)-glutamine methyltransferase [bacterium]|nr:peptide chain release factor N(5)-glutamine methyltransferase [bacterium]